MSGGELCVHSESGIGQLLDEKVDVVPGTLTVVWGSVLCGTTGPVVVAGGSDDVVTPP